MYPNVIVKNINWGIASKKKSKYELKYKLFIPFSMIPNNIYKTPTIMENFILKELINAVSLAD